MAEVQPEFTSRLPRWLAWYLEYGVEGKTKRDQRRQFTGNVIMALSVLTSVLYSGGFFLYDPELWPTCAVAVALGVQFFILPFAFNRYPNATIALSTVFSCAAFSFQTYLVGTETGLYLYLLLIPAIWLAVLGPGKPIHLFSTTLIGIVAILLSVFCFGAPALQAAQQPILQALLMSTSVIWVGLLILAFGYVAFQRAERAEDALEAEHARSEALLYNLLPTEIAARLKDAPDQTIADSLDHTAILFADIVNFTPRSARMSPEALVEFLNRIFSTFDQLAAKHGLEKIKTIGDAYMVAAGLPQPVDRPVHRVAEMAFEMLAALRDLSTELNDPIDIRIGLHAGPVVAGVIGHQKLFYDVWGDTVNTASRMESHGQPGRIQVTAAARDALRDAYDFEPRGAVEIKGIGALETWWLVQKA
ncbi:adenylate/guanylate cyclase domain-containing protein [Ruegeria pomeroyi]|nr:adenylate/guanylate cyclase domain-containing protein [Ruegeria pomeroyi]